jgi:hypothetical protein
MKHRTLIHRAVKEGYNCNPDNQMERRLYHEWVEMTRIPLFTGRPERDTPISDTDVAILLQHLEQWNDVRDFIERA